MDSSSAYVDAPTSNFWASYSSSTSNVDFKRDTLQDSTSFKLTCTFGSGTSAVTLTSNAYTASVTIDCPSYVAKPTLSATVLTQASSQTSTYALSTYMSSSQSTYCGISSCILKRLDGSTWVDTTSSDWAYYDSSSTSVKVSRDMVKAVTSYKLECTIASGTTRQFTSTTSEYSISVETDCSTALSSTVASLSYDYSSGVTETVSAANFITTTDSTTCGLSQCVLKRQDGSNWVDSTSSDWAYYDSSSSSLKISRGTKQAATTFKYSCTVASGGQQQFTKDTITFTITIPLNCLTLTTTSSALTTQTFEPSTGQFRTVSRDTWISTQDSTNCPLSSCVLNKDSSGTFVATTSSDWVYYDEANLQIKVNVNTQQDPVTHQFQCTAGNAGEQVTLTTNSFLIKVFAVCRQTTDLSYKSAYQYSQTVTFRVGYVDTAVASNFANKVIFTDKSEFIDVFDTSRCPTYSMSIIQVSGPSETVYTFDTATGALSIPPAPKSTTYQYRIRITVTQDPVLTMDTAKLSFQFSYCRDITPIVSPLTYTFSRPTGDTSEWTVLTASTDVFATSYDPNFCTFKQYGLNWQWYTPTNYQKAQIDTATGRIYLAYEDCTSVDFMPQYFQLMLYFNAHQNLEFQKYTSGFTAHNCQPIGTCDIKLSSSNTIANQKLYTVNTWYNQSRYVLIGKVKDYFTFNTPACSPKFYWSNTASNSGVFSEDIKYDSSTDNLYLNISNRVFKHQLYIGFDYTGPKYNRANINTNQFWIWFPFCDPSLNYTYSQLPKVPQLQVQQDDCNSTKPCVLSASQLSYTKKKPGYCNSTIEFFKVTKGKSASDKTATTIDATSIITFDNTTMDISLKRTLISDAGVYQVFANLTNGQEINRTVQVAEFTIVYIPPINQPPYFSTTPSPISLKAGVDFSDVKLPKIADKEKDSISSIAIKLSNSQLARYITFTTDNDAGSIILNAGSIPSSIDPSLVGTFTITFTVTDSASKSFTSTVDLTIAASDTQASSSSDSNNSTSNSNSTTDTTTASTNTTNNTTNTGDNQTASSSNSDNSSSVQSSSSKSSTSSSQSSSSKASTSTSRPAFTPISSNSNPFSLEKEVVEEKLVVVELPKDPIIYLDQGGRISKISQTGDVYIKLIEPCQPPDNFTIDDIEFQVDPSPETVSAFQGKNLEELLAFTWTYVTYYESNQSLLFILEFQDSGKVSSQVKMDNLVVNFLKKDLFRSNEANTVITMGKQYMSMTRSIPKQLPSGAAIEALMSSTAALESIQATFLQVQLGLSLVFDGLMTFIMNIVGILQVIFILPGIPINFPSNVNFFYQALMPFVTFDILSPDYSTKLLFEFNEDEVSPYSDPLANLGFDQSNLILNVGSVFIFGGIMCIQTIFIVGVKTIQIGLTIAQSITSTSTSIKSQFEGGDEEETESDDEPKPDSKWEVAWTLTQRLSRKMEKSLLFNGFIMVFIGNFPSFVLAGYLGYQRPVMDKIYDTPLNGEYVSYYLSFPILVITVIIIPALTIWVGILRSDTINNEGFKERFGELYSRTLPYTHIQRFSTFIFLLRRLAILSVMLFLLDLGPGIKCVILLMVNLYTSIYVFGVEHLEDPKETRVHRLNELLIDVGVLHAIFFTDFVPDIDTQFLLGFSLIGVTLITFIYNLVRGVSLAIVESFKLLRKKYWLWKMREKVIKLHQDHIRSETAPYLRQNKIVIQVAEEESNSDEDGEKPIKMKEKIMRRIVKSLKGLKDDIKKGLKKRPGSADQKKKVELTKKEKQDFIKKEKKRQNQSPAVNPITSGNVNQTKNQTKPLDFFQYLEEQNKANSKKLSRNKRSKMKRATKLAEIKEESEGDWDQQELTNRKDERKEEEQKKYMSQLISFFGAGQKGGQQIEPDMTKDKYEKEKEQILPLQTVKKTLISDLVLKAKRMKERQKVQTSGTVPIISKDKQ